MNYKTLSLLAALGASALATTLGCGSAPPHPPATAATAPADPGDDDDADDDGIPDTADKCPDQKEDGKGAATKDGCPNP